MITLHHVLIPLRLAGPAVDLTHLLLGVLHGAGDVVLAHADEPGEAAEEPAAHDPQQRPHVQLGLLLGQPDPQLVAEHGQAGVHLAHDLPEDLVERLQDELNKAALGRAVRGLRGELPGLGVVVNIAPQSGGELFRVDPAVSVRVELREGEEREADPVLRAGEADVSFHRRQLGAVSVGVEREKTVALLHDVSQLVVGVLGW